MSLETREIKLFGRDIPGFCRDIPGVPEKFEKKKFVFNFRSLSGLPTRDRVTKLPFSTQTLPTDKNSGGINFGKDYSMITD